MGHAQNGVKLRRLRCCTGPAYGADDRASWDGGAEVSRTSHGWTELARRFAASGAHAEVTPTDLLAARGLFG
jgi:hypothetical protein